MEPRIDYLKAGRGVVEAMLGFERNIRQSGPDESLIDLVKLRASQLDGCALLHRYALEGSAGAR